MVKSRYTRCIETGEVFKTQTDAARWILAHTDLITPPHQVASEISKHLRGKETQKDGQTYKDHRDYYANKDIYGYHFERVIGKGHKGTKYK